MKKFIAYLGFATLITLYGCSSPEEPAPEPVEQVAESAPAEKAESTPTETVDPAEPTNNEVVTGDNPIHVGDTFEFNITNMAGETTPWHIKITDVETVNELPEIDATPKRATNSSTPHTKQPTSQNAPTASCSQPESHTQTEPSWHPKTQMPTAWTSPTYVKTMQAPNKTQATHTPATS